MLEELFSIKEQEEYLTSIGYVHQQLDIFVKDHKEYRRDEIFLKEMKIKFKCVLLNKGVLKLKLGS